MKKLFLFGNMIALSLVCPVFATENVEGTVAPDQTVQNTKGFAGINYDRQDTESTGKQVIVNDHSAFNINVNIIKKGALFKKDKDNNTEL